MAERRLVDVLEALPPGARLWVEAKGLSLWPLIRPSDRVCIEKTVDEPRPGDIVLRARGALVLAHIVTATHPLRTESIVGIVDTDCGPALARVVTIARGATRLNLPAVSRPVLGRLPAAARLAKRLPFAKQLVRALRGRLG